MIYTAHGWDVKMAKNRPLRGRLAVIPSGHIFANYRPGYPGIEGINDANPSVFYEDSKRTIATILTWLTGKATGANFLIVTQEDTLAFGTKFRQILGELGHTYTLTGSVSSWNGYEPLDYDAMIMNERAQNTSGYHGIPGIGTTNEQEQLAFIVQNGGHILGFIGTYNMFTSFGFDVSGWHASHYSSGEVGGPPGWRYQNPFTSSWLGDPGVGGSWNTSYYAMTRYTVFHMLPGTNSRGGQTHMASCALDSSGILGLWEP